MKSTASLVTLLLVCLWTALVHAQTQTLVDVAGETVVVVVTINPIQGLPSTRTIQTLDGADEATSTSTTTTRNAGPVVGQPPPTQTGQTTFQYTTTDAAGDTQVLTGIFTPSTALATGDVITTIQGTIMDYSSWVDMVGTNTVAPTDLAVGSGALPGRLLLSSRKALAAGVSIVCGALGSAWLLVL